MKRLLLFLLCALPSFGTWARVQQVHAYCGDSASTCPMTVTSPTAGHLLAVAAMYTGSTVSISSVSGLGTWVHPSGCAASAAGFQAMDWAYTLSATTGTSLTITLSATAAFVDVFFFEYSGTSPFTYETCGTVFGGVAYANPPAGSITTTGANDLAIAGVYGGTSTFTSSSAVSPTPWSTPNFLVNGGEAFAEALNFSATTTQALFTDSAADYTVGSTLAFHDAAVATFMRKRAMVTWRRSDGLASTPVVNYMSQVAADMSGSHEGTPHGVPSGYDWYSGPVVEDGNTPPSGTHAIVVWGVVLVDSTATGNPPSNTRVNVRNMRLYILSSSSHTWSTFTWYSGSTNAPGSDSYSEDWTNSGYTALMRTETDGTLSFVAGNQATNSGITCPNTGATDSNCDAHWYTPFPRLAITASDVAGVVACEEGRLILANTSAADDRASSHYMLNVGADYYPSISSGGISNNPGVMLGKFKYPGNNWRSFCASTLNLSTLNANPPPVNLLGDLP